MRLLFSFLGPKDSFSCHFLLQGIYSTQGLNPCLLVSPALVSRFFAAEPPGKVAVSLPNLFDVLVSVPFFFFNLKLFILYWDIASQCS